MKRKTDIVDREMYGGENRPGGRGVRASWKAQERERERDTLDKARQEERERGS